MTSIPAQPAFVLTITATPIFCNQRSNGQTRRRPSHGTIQGMLLPLLAAVLQPCHFLTALTVHLIIPSSSAAMSVGTQEIPLAHPMNQHAVLKPMPAEGRSAPEWHVRHTPIVRQVSGLRLSVLIVSLNKDADIVCFGSK